MMYYVGMGEYPNMNRRDFLKGLGAVAAGASTVPERVEAFEGEEFEFLNKKTIQKELDWINETHGHKFIGGGKLIYAGHDVLIDNEKVLIHFSLNGNTYTVDIPFLYKNPESQFDVAGASEGGYIFKPEAISAIVYLYLENNGLIEPLP